MVKLTEVEDEHFTDKPIPTKGDALLVSDDEEDYTDTGKCLTNICRSSPSSPMHISQWDLDINLHPERPNSSPYTPEYVPQTRPAQNDASANPSPDLLRTDIITTTASNTKADHYFSLIQTPRSPTRMRRTSSSRRSPSTSVSPP